MATSYANTGGTGNRTSIITVSDNATGGGAIIVGPSAPAAPSWVDGNTSDNTSWIAAVSVSGRAITFDWGPGASKVIDEAKMYQQTSATHGTWNWRATTDLSVWTDIGSNFTLGGATVNTLTGLSGNTTGYRAYQVMGISGTGNSGPYIHEWEFKIGDPGGGGVVIPVFMNQYRQRWA